MTVWICDTCFAKNPSEELCVGRIITGPCDVCGQPIPDAHRGHAVRSIRDLEREKADRALGAQSASGNRSSEELLAEKAGRDIK